MRYYLIDNEGKELILDLHNTKKHSAIMYEFHFSLIRENKPFLNSKVFIRSLAGYYFTSVDTIMWKKIARQELSGSILSVNQVLQLFRGYKPSGISGSDKGELVNQMPGLVVKVVVAEGMKVSKGQPLIIIEAMKMENEITSAVDGVIKAIHVKERQALEKGTLMMEIEPL